MAESPKRRQSGSLRTILASDLCHAVFMLVSFISPILPLLLLVLSDQPVEHNRKMILLAVSGALLIVAICVFIRFFFGLFTIRGTVERVLEQYHKIRDPFEQTGDIHESLIKLDQYLHTWVEDKYRLEILQKQANLNAFQSQINPHFLYNMLDTIRGQALEDGSIITSDMIEALSRMMRYAISNKDSMVKLGVEIKSIENYIKIQQFRFVGRFQFFKCLDEIDNDLIDLDIPKMTLQPIVENAIFHGIESLISGGEIRLTGFNTQSLLVIQIADNGIGMDEIQLDEVRRKLRSPDTDNGGSEKKGTGIALANVNARLKLVFGSRYGLSVFSTQNVGTMVEITIPITDRSG